jgi:transposase
VVVPDGRGVEVQEHEQIVERVAAIDVAKASGMVCTRVPHQTTPGKPITRVWEVAARTNAIIALADQLTGQGIEWVVVESTSDYWRGLSTCWKPVGCGCGWSTLATPEQVPGRPKTDKLDAVWLAKLNERGMLRPSFIPPAEIRQLRDYTRLRSDLTQERSRHVQRLEQAAQGRPDQAVHRGHRHRGCLGSGHAGSPARRAARPEGAGRARQGRMRGKRAALVQALTGRFDDHHAELARLLLDHLDALTTQIDRLTARIEALIGAVPAAQPPQDKAGHTGEGTHQQAAPVGLPAVDRLDEVPGIGGKAAQVIIAEIGLDMGQFPTAAHLVSWAKLSPRTIQSGATHRAGTTGKANPYLKGVLGEAAAAAAKTNTFLGERYRRLVKRRGKLQALVAVARSILVIIWHLLADPTARFHDLGADFYTNPTNTDRKTRNHIRQLQALGFTVTLTPAA